MLKLFIKNFSIFILFFLSICLISEIYTIKKEIKISGKTMGTVYDIKVIGNLFFNKNKLENTIIFHLSEINKKLSYHDKKSEISAFNFISNINNSMNPSKDFLNILLISKKMHKILGEIWDPSISPLLNIWGFGIKKKRYSNLDLISLNLLLKNVNFRKAVIITKHGLIKKGISNSNINLSSIAKGYGVDQISIILYNMKFKDFLIEIGGEIYSSGKKLNGDKWCIGLNYPDMIFYLKRIYKTILISNKAIATSGDYRNFVKIDNKVYSHIINPLTGYPTKSSINSVSIIAENCTVADALSTAIMVGPTYEAIVMINKLQKVEAIISSIEKNGDIINYLSNGINS